MHPIHRLRRDVKMTAEVPHLPAEIHRLIAQYVSREDLPSYRLANKVFCEIGTHELFSTVIFHYSCASIGRLNELRASGRLRGCVKTIFWDTNLWQIPRLYSMHEWMLYFTYARDIYRPLQGRSASEELYATRSVELSRNRHEWEAYIEKMGDEKLARQAAKQLAALGCFPNLRALHMVNGELLPAHRGVRKVAHSLPRVRATPPILRRGEGVSAFYSLPGIEAFRAIQQQCTSSLRKLKLNRVNPQAFTSSAPGNLHGLTSLEVTIFGYLGDYRFGGKMSLDFLIGNLRIFLAGLPQLASLKVGLENGAANDSRLFSTIHHVFDSETTWSKLRKLSLCGMCATPHTLVSLLERHSSTLEDLRLRDISWETDGNDASEEGHNVALRSIQHCAWPRVLQKIAECLSLKRSTASGTLGEDGYVFGWRLDEDDELAADVENYLISGGECPLTAENAKFAIDDCELPPISNASQHAV